jgi:GH15 family glucan-1,4-alpha-glucosidase
MPRDLPLGNGSLLVNFDRDYQIRDIYYPHVGKENHSEGHPFRLGLWADQKFAWMGPSWILSMRYLPGTLVTDVRAEHQDLGVLLHVNDAVDFHEAILLRHFCVRNLAPRAREVRLFFHHDFHISESDVGDTALWDPQLSSLIHYKGHYYFLMNVQAGGRIGFDQYATGIKRNGGREGTWRDAEDGTLGGNPITQGSVDSVGAVHLTVPGGGEAGCFYWMTVGRTHQEVRLLNQLIIEKTPGRLLDRTADYWRLWVSANDPDFDPLPKPVVDLYRRSLLVLRTQIDNNGAIVAANDSDVMQFSRDTYSYMWPRDGALVAHALDKAGYFELAKRFYFFCSQIIREEGFFLHKYTPDGAPASSWHPWVKDGRPQLPIQEDETALVVWALWHHFDRYRNTEFIKPLYRPLITRAGDFMESYRDRRTGLPLPSYDLWEERHGVFAFTTAAVHGGLLAAARFAFAFGERDRGVAYARAAEEVRNGMDKHLYSEAHGRFLRMITPNGARFEEDPTLDASLYGLFAFGAYDPIDPRVAATMRAVEDRLQVKTEVGGLARYERDSYHSVGDDSGRVPGNPWFICALWLAQYRIARAQHIDELEQALPILDWVTSRALPSGVLSEQVHPHTGAPLSVSPLTWSHSTLVLTIVEYLEKRRTLGRCQTCSGPSFARRWITNGDWYQPAVPEAAAARVDA